ncbi:MAG TPA: hypothetical protein PKV13_00005 [Propionicimonas sp.]|nr:hypothetical protein [Propionicimonas sp.]HRA04985.1 hypothetical protein [Propionicimonas sp.]
MDELYTRSGRLLQRSGDQLHSRTGSYLGQLRDGKVFDPSGRYCGTIVGDRVVYRTIDSAAVGAASVGEGCPPSTHANQSGKALWGVEPPFAD